MAMNNIVPHAAPKILERALDILRVRANSNGKCYGGEIMDALREAGAALGINHLEVLLTRTVLVRTMESMGEPYPADVLENYDERMLESTAIKYLHTAIDYARRQQEVN